MFKRMFRKSKKETKVVPSLESKKEAEVVPSLDKLSKALAELEKKEKLYIKKAEDELRKAREHTKKQNKREAIRCLKKKKLYEQQILCLGNSQLTIHNQMIMLEGTDSTVSTVDALRTAAAAMKVMQKATNINDVDKTMEEIQEQTDNLKQVQEALSLAVDFDEDELEAELEELESAGLEEKLLQPVTRAHVAPVQVPAGQRPVYHDERNLETEVDELTAQQAELTL